jgi:hypothetical protein
MEVTVTTAAGAKHWLAKLDAVVANHQIWSDYNNVNDLLTWRRGWWAKFRGRENKFPKRKRYGGAMWQQRRHDRLTELLTELTDNSGNPQYFVTLSESENHNIGEWARNSDYADFMAVVAEHPGLLEAWDAAIAAKTTKRAFWAWKVYPPLD